MSRYSSAQREFGDLIWTNHALDRLSQRRILQQDALEAVRQGKRGKSSLPNTFTYTHMVRRRPIQVVVLKDQNKMIVKSVWVRGERDEGMLWQVLRWLWKRFLRRKY